MNFLDVILIAIVEGITEFLPISSTGHMILASYFLGISEDEFTKTFEVFIQLGAILAIVFLYARQVILKFDFPGLIQFCLKLFVAFLPSAVLGFLLYDIIKTYLFNHWVVAVSLIVGGVVLIWLDKKMNMKVASQGNAVAAAVSVGVEQKQQGMNMQHDDLANVSYKMALFIGCFQCISMIPGVSRAAATIIGGMVNGLQKKSAAEFSFLLAIPTMTAASVLDLAEFEDNLTGTQWQMLGVGFVIAFLTAIVAVKLFVAFLNRGGFAPFGWYRIVVGVLFLLYAALVGDLNFQNLLN